MQPTQELEPIGTARMKDDGTIVLRLRARSDGSTGEAVLVYKPDNPQYQSIKAHIGSIKPNEEKLVHSWTDQ